jgi:hypothetical protein
MTSSNGRDMPLAKLRDALTITPGQKIGYVTDVANTADNRKAIVIWLGTPTFSLLRLDRGQDAEQHGGAARICSLVA